MFTIDLLPTLAHLAGAELPENPIDGRNVWPLIRGDPDATSPHDYYAFGMGSGLDGVISGDGRWKLHVPHPYHTLIRPGRDGGPGETAARDIGLALFAANVGVWPMIEGLIEGGQKTYKRMKYAPFPVVAAPSGMALGGGCEMILHSAAVQAHAETYTGLVEVGVGVLPGWGGCKELVTRWTVAKKPANVSILSASATTMLTGAVGQRSFGPWGA